MDVQHCYTLLSFKNEFLVVLFGASQGLMRTVLAKSTAVTRCGSARHSLKHRRGKQAAFNLGSFVQLIFFTYLHPYRAGMAKNNFFQFCNR